MDRRRFLLTSLAGALAAPLAAQAQQTVRVPRVGIVGLTGIRACRFLCIKHSGAGWLISVGSKARMLSLKVDGQKEIRAGCHNS